jgi:hypothetical protein
MRRGTVAAPFKLPHPPTEVSQRNGFAELPVKVAERSEFLLQQREKPPLHVTEDCRKVEHQACD